MGWEKLERGFRGFGGWPEAVHEWKSNKRMCALQLLHFNN